MGAWLEAAMKPVTVDMIPAALPFIAEFCVGLRLIAGTSSEW